MAAEHPVKARCGVCARAARTWEDDSCGRLMAIDPPGDDWHFGGAPRSLLSPCRTLATPKAAPGVGPSTGPLTGAADNREQR